MENNEPLLSLIVQVFNGQNRNNINQQLLDYLATKDSWHTSMSLLNSHNVQVCFFSANVVLTKVKSNWSQLNVEEKKNIYDRILTILQLRYIDNRTETQNSQQFLINHADGVCVGLTMLALLPEELEMADINPSAREEMRDKLLIFGNQLQESIDVLCSNVCRPEVVVKVMELIRHWLPHGISLTSLCTSYVNIFHCICGALGSVEKDVFRSALRLVHDATNTTEYPESNTRQLAVLQFAESIASNLDSKVANDHEVLNQLSQTLTCMAAKHTGLLLENCPKFFSCFLMCLSCRPRSLLEISYDYWMELQDIPVLERSPLLGELVLSLFRVILQHALWSALEDDDREDWESFRDLRLGLPEVVSVCLFTMGDSFFQALQDFLSCQNTSGSAQREVVMFVLGMISEPIKSIISNNNGGGFARGSILLWLFSVTRDVLVGGSDISSEGLNAQIVKTTCTYLGSVTHILVMPVVFVSGGNIVSNAASDATMLDCRPLYFLAVDLLFRVALSPGLDPDTARTATRSLQKLCVHGAKWLTEPIVNGDFSGATVDDVFVPLTALVRRFGGCIRNDVSVSETTLLPVIESLVRCISAISLKHSGLRSTLLSLVYEPLLEGLHVCTVVEQRVTNAAKAETMLSCISQVVRFCDSTMCGTGCRHCLEPLVAVLWPVLDWLLNSGAVELAEWRLHSAVFLLFERLFGSLGAMALSVTQAVSNAIVSSLSSGSPSCSAALHCGTVMAEFLLHNDELQSAVSALKSFLLRVVAVLGGCNRPSLFPNDSECVTEFFSLVYHCAVFCPLVLVEDSACLDTIICLAYHCLDSCAEREPLRAILQVLQYGFCPPMESPVRQAVIECHLKWGQRFVRLMLFGFTQNKFLSSLAPHFAELLLAIMTSGQETCGVECHNWLYSTALEQTCLYQLETVEAKQMFLSAAENLCLSNTRRFKSLIQDLFKICSKELTTDTLIAYS